MTIRTPEQLEELLRNVGEQGECAVVVEGCRPWIITEDDRGDTWAWSWHEDGEERSCKSAESLGLPLAVLRSPVVSDVTPAGTYEALDEAVRAHVATSDGRPSIVSGWVLVAASESDGKSTSYALSASSSPTHITVGLLHTGLVIAQEDA